MEVDRGGAILAFDVVPDNGKIRVVPPTEHVDVSLGAAIARGLTAPARVVAGTMKSVAGIFRGERTEVTGAVGVSKEVVAAEHERSGQSLRLDAVLGAYVLPFVFVLSVALVLTRRRSE